MRETYSSRTGNFLSATAFQRKMQPVLLLLIADGSDHSNVVHFGSRLSSAVLWSRVAALAHRWRTNLTVGTSYWKFRVRVWSPWLHRGACTHFGATQRTSWAQWNIFLTQDDWRNLTEKKNYKKRNLEKLVRFPHGQCRKETLSENIFFCISDVMHEEKHFESCKSEQSKRKVEKKSRRKKWSERGFIDAKFSN